MTKGVAWLRDNSLRMELLMLLKTWCYFEQSDGDNELEGEHTLDIRDVLLTERGRFLAGALCSHAIEFHRPDAVALATVKASDDCLMLAITDQTVGTYRNRGMGRMRFRTMNAFFGPEVLSASYLDELLGLRPKDEVVIVVGVANYLLEVWIRATVEQLRSRGLVVNGCLALVNDLENDVDLKVELISIYARSDFKR